MADKLQKDFLSLKEKCAALDKKGYVTTYFKPAEGLIYYLKDRRKYK